MTIRGRTLHRGPMEDDKRRCLSHADCEYGLYCNRGSCGLPGYGDPCAASHHLCAGGTRCSEWGRCVYNDERQLDENACIWSGGCSKTTYCENHQCVPLKSLGEKCALDLECKDGLSCFASQCRTNVLEPENCRSGEKFYRRPGYQYGVCMPLVERLPGELLYTKVISMVAAVLIVALSGYIVYRKWGKTADKTIPTRGPMSTSRTATFSPLDAPPAYSAFSDHGPSSKTSAKVNAHASSPAYGKHKH